MDEKIRKFLDDFSSDMNNRKIQFELEIKKRVDQITQEYEALQNQMNQYKQSLDSYPSNLINSLNCKKSQGCLQVG